MISKPNCYIPVIEDWAGFFFFLLVCLFPLICFKKYYCIIIIFIPKLPVASFHMEFSVTAVYVQKLQFLFYAYKFASLGNHVILCM